jgi:hypothetical protein
MLTEGRRAVDLVESGECEGACVDHGGHKGECKLCRVTAKDGKDWGLFSYCATAQSFDESKEFTVEVVAECETCCGSGTVLDHNKFTLDKGKWMRLFDETISVECPECGGLKYLC